MTKQDIWSLSVLPAADRQELLDIISGRKLPSLYSDVIAKTIFNADAHPERLNFLLRNIVKDETIDVSSSASNEGFHQSLNAKSMITDVPSWLRDGRISDMEFQKLKQDFIFTRIELYASDMLLLQYSTSYAQKKGDLTYETINEAILVVLMVESPKAFQEYDKQCERYIHRFTKMTADTGLSYPSKAKMIYVQLDKCLKQFQQNRNAECADGQPDQLQLWLSMIADVNDAAVVKAAQDIAPLAEIREEAYRMSQSKEVQTMYFQEKYDRLDWASYGSQQRHEGIVEGEAKGIFDTLSSLVEKGFLSLSDAAQQAGVTEEAFRQKMQARL